jgi:hypothetical protein
MPKSIIFIVWMFGWMISGHAQNESPIVVMGAQGKISYQAPGYSSKKISAGTLFKSVRRWPVSDHPGAKNECLEGCFYGSGRFDENQF